MIFIAASTTGGSPLRQPREAAIPALEPLKSRHFTGLSCTRPVAHPSVY